MLGIFVAVFSFSIANPIGVRINYSAEKRIRMVANIVHRAQKTLIISTGCLDSGVYSSSLVVRAFRELGEDVKIFIFHRSDELSEESRELIDYLVSRNTEFISWKDMNTERIPRDFIISDMEHIRVELSDGKAERNQGNKFAIYFYDNQTMPSFYYKKYLNRLPIQIH